MNLKFWGVRGGIPTPGPQTVKYGGNTLCLELEIQQAQRRIIIDAGSGIRQLGNRLIHRKANGDSITADLFLTHTHIDHILGLPFFAPIYMSDTDLKIYGPVTCEEEPLELVIGTQLSYRYFPVRQAELAANIEYLNLQEGHFDLGDGIKLITKYLNHPLLCLGYRFEYRGKSICTAYDTEPFYNVFSTDTNDPSYDEAMAKEGALAAQIENRRIEDFIRGTDILIHDAQYLLSEYETGRTGWGHASIEHAIETARRSQVETLVLIHHDPMRTDSEIDDLTERFCQSKHSPDTQVFFAREGMVLDV